MSNLITYAAYKTYNNITDDTNQTLAESLITVASNQIELYCDRIFAEDTYIEEVKRLGCSHYVTPRQYPVNKILLTAEQSDAFTVKNNGTISYTLSIKDSVLTITTEALTETTYDLTNASYDTLTELKAVIEAAFTDLSITIDSDVIQYSRFLLDQYQTIESSATVTIYGAKATDIDIKVENNQFNVGSDCIVVYKAGYSTIPVDLQYVVARIVYDTVNVALAESGSSNLKSESITNYSYTLADNINLQTIISGYIGNYGSTLDAYRRINF